MNTSYDTLTITINADSKQANSSVKALSTNLQHLEEVAKNLDTKAIVEVKKLLQDIAKIDFSNVSKGLQDVVSAFKAFSSNKFLKNSAKSISGELIDSGTVKNELVAINQQLEDFETEKQEVFDFTSANQSIETTLTQVDRLAELLVYAGLKGEQINEIFRSIQKQDKIFNSEDLAKAVHALEGAGYSSEQANEIIKNLKTNLQELLSS